MSAPILASLEGRDLPVTVPILDLRTRRDLLARRIVREATRTTARVSVLLALDGAAVAAAFALTGIQLSGATIFHPAFLSLWAILVLGQASLGTYGGWDGRRDYPRILLGAVLATAGVVSVLQIPPFPLSGPSWWAVVVVLPVVVALLRASLEIGLRAVYSRGVGLRRVLVIADQDRPGMALAGCRLAGFPGIDLVGHLTRDRTRDAEALGSLDQLGETLEAHRIDLVAVTSRVSGDELGNLIQECFLHGVSVSLAMADVPSVPGDRRGLRVMGWPLLEVSLPRLYVAQLILKRSVDVLVAAVALFLLWPLLLLIALVVALDSPGPVVFRQNRPGLGGRPFRMLKFRSMRLDAEAVLEADPVLYQKFLEGDCKLPAELDPRVTRVGRFLRGSSLDELPQLFNVLLGDMTLVGPRPIVGPELHHYGSWATTILSVKPGLTGYWQVHGRSEVPFPDRATMDLHYVMNWSFAMDLRLLVLTLPAVLRRRGAF